jgi:hypothetical protein
MMERVCNVKGMNDKNESIVEVVMFSRKRHESSNVKHARSFFTAHLCMLQVARTPERIHESPDSERFPEYGSRESYRQSRIPRASANNYTVA